MKRRLWAAVSGVLLLLVASGASAWSWRDLLQTPEQQARSDLNAERYEALANNPQLPQWQAVGQYRQGDYAKAAEQFEQLAANFDTKDSLSDAERQELLSLRYNQATTLTQAGEYQAALTHYDQVLELAPEHESAINNRAITQALLEQQQQQQQSDQSSDGEQGESSDDASGQSQSGPESGSEADAQQNSSNESGAEDGSEQASDADTQPGQDGAGNTEQTPDFAEMMEGEDAQNADGSEPLAQEQQRPAEDNAGAADVITVGEGDVSEDQQATEQWLRQIEDDPSGLLRRKLQRSHMTDHPTVRDSVTPW